MTVAAPSVQTLSDVEFNRSMAGTTGATVVVVSTAWCTPCRLLAPVVRHFARKMPATFIALDGDAASDAMDRYEVASFPQLLLFRDGVFLERISGFAGYDAVREPLARFLGWETAPCDAAGEQAFRDAVASERERICDRLRAPEAEIDVHFAAVAPELDALEVALTEQVTAGILTRAELATSMRAGQERLFAPFQHKIDALDAMTDEAIADYAAALDAAASDRANPLAGASPATGGAPMHCSANNACGRSPG